MGASTVKGPAGTGGWLTTGQAAGLRRTSCVEIRVNGLTLPHSSGAVEGSVCRIKALLRQMFGRANLDLLRKRILLGT
jgi:transposase